MPGRPYHFESVDKENIQESILLNKIGSGREQVKFVVDSSCFLINDDHLHDSLHSRVVR